MKSFFFAALFLCLVVSCLATVTNCPDNYGDVCRARIDQMSFGSENENRKECKRRGGYLNGGGKSEYCHIEKGNLFTPSGCCENGK